MHDLKWIRENPDAFDEGLTKRGLEPQAQEILRLDEARRLTVTQLQDLQARRNAASKEIGKAKGKGGDPAKAGQLMAEVAKIKELIQSGEEDERQRDRDLQTRLQSLPNLPLDDVPVGGESANKELRSWGKKPALKFEPKQHFDIGETLGLMDFEAAARLSGARFVVLKGALARLERALGQFMLDLHTGEFGYTEMSVPLLVRDEAAIGTGQLPKFENDLFSTKSEERIGKDEFDVTDIQNGEVKIAFRGKRAEELRRAFFSTQAQRIDFVGGRIPPGANPLEAIKGMITPVIVSTRWSIPTAEIPLTNMVREQVLAEALPCRCAIPRLRRASALRRGRPARTRAAWCASISSGRWNSSPSPRRSSQRRSWSA